MRMQREQFSTTTERRPALIFLFRGSTLLFIEVKYEFHDISNDFIENLFTKSAFASTTKACSYGHLLSDQ